MKFRDGGRLLLKVSLFFYVYVYEGRMVCTMSDLVFLFVFLKNKLLIVESNFVFFCFFCFLKKQKKHKKNNTHRERPERSFR